ncbi:MAG: DUF6249 domain-containing protein [Bacteroidales bacterium]
MLMYILFVLEDVLDSFLPIIAVIAPFVCAILIVLFFVQNKFKTEKEKCDVIKEAVKNNYKLPTEFYETSKKRKKSPLDSAVTMLILGLALLISSLINGVNGHFQIIMTTVALVFLLIGISRLIIHSAYKKEKEKNRLNDKVEDTSSDDE